MDARVSLVGPSSPVSDIYHRPYLTVRQSSTSSGIHGKGTIRLAPLLPPTGPHEFGTGNESSSGGQEKAPSIYGMPLKYVSLVTLAVQNAALAVVMHYSRVAIPPSQAYSPAAAVLLNELLKGAISFVVAFLRMDESGHAVSRRTMGGLPMLSNRPSRLARLWAAVFSLDCWKLSIPAILYVIQNSLQFVAISNLPVATFQVTYQMKILTTAAFTVALIRKKLSPTKWIALLFLALGVGIVQIQATTSTKPKKHAIPVGSAHDSAPIDLDIHIMNPLIGFAAVTAACFTSGLAGVYFEMVLKNSKADLWVRNVQLSLFSLIPALLPILYTSSPLSPHSRGFVSDIFNNFGAWAWATVGMQVFGGLVTAIVIKYSDNILKGFATSLSIIISFLASVALFDFRITPAFIIGSSTVLAATWLYNQPDRKDGSLSVLGSKVPTPFGTPPGPDEPILGRPSIEKRGSPFSSPRAFAAAVGLSASSENLAAHRNDSNDYLNTVYLSAPYGSPYSSRTPSRSPSPKHSAADTSFHR